MDDPHASVIEITDTHIGFIVFAVLEEIRRNYFEAITAENQFGEELPVFGGGEWDMAKPFQRFEYGLFNNEVGIAKRVHIEACFDTGADRGVSIEVDPLAILADTEFGKVAGHAIGTGSGNSTNKSGGHVGPRNIVGIAKDDIVAIGKRGSAVAGFAEALVFLFEEAKPRIILQLVFPFGKNAFGIGVGGAVINEDKLNVRVILCGHGFNLLPDIATVVVVGEAQADQWLFRLGGAELAVFVGNHCQAIRMHFQPFLAGIFRIVMTVWGWKFAINSFENFCRNRPRIIFE